MTRFPSSSSPNCVRSLEAQLEATSLEQSQEQENQLHLKCPTPCVSSPMASPRVQVISLTATRNLIFRLSAGAGCLSSLFLNSDTRDHDSGTFAANAEISNATAQLLMTLMEISCLLSINLHTACSKKIDLNCRKYPVELCKGKAGKYTEYSKSTGITKSIGQSTVDENSIVPSCNSALWSDHFIQQSVPALTKRTRQFAVDRDWLPYHTPRNLLLALIGELGELAEIFQFMGDDESRILSLEEKDKVGQEIADVTIYLLRLADVCGICLKDEAERIHRDN